MPDIVLDASVALRWVLRDERSSPADAVFVQWEKGELQILVPPLFWAEVINGLYQAHRRQRLSWERVQEGFLLLATLDFQTVVVDLDLYQQALLKAREFSAEATYDFVYIAFAQAHGIEFWHSDRRLADRLQGQLAWVHYVG